MTATTAAVGMATMAAAAAAAAGTAAAATVAAPVQVDNQRYINTAQ